MAMALKIASMGAEKPIELDDPGCVAKSFPGFWEMFDY
jgi:5-enolpyruvylshikimate-3-phosphate synthase